MARKQGSHQYDDAFRAQAVALVIDQKMPVSAEAKQVGVSYETLRKWVQESGRTREDEESKSDKQRIKELERELKAARMERGILKEAVDGLPSVNARNLAAADSSTIIGHGGQSWLSRRRCRSRGKGTTFGRNAMYQRHLSDVASCRSVCLRSLWRATVRTARRGSRVRYATRVNV